MKTLPTDLIFLASYLDKRARAEVSRLYLTHGWPFEPPDAWAWRYADVCALYFRFNRYAAMSDRDQETLRNIRHAIDDYLADEFS